VQVSSTLIPQNVGVSKGLTAFTAQSSSSIRQAATFPADNPLMVSIGVTIPSVTNVNTIDTAKYIFLGVTAGDGLHLAQIEVHNHDDDQFFHVLRGNYHRLRGLFREWFGIWKFSHCDFVKVSMPIALAT
jgi:hypothetical protein